MKTSYTVEGMTCMSCVARVQAALESVPGVQSAKVDLKNKEASITTQEPIALTEYKKVLGHYKISEVKQASMLDTTTALPFSLPLAVRESPPLALHEALQQKEEELTLPNKTWSTYKPLFLIVSFIAGVTFLAQYPFQNFDAMLWMRHFMAGFFIVFSFFKLLNLSGFANSYSMYDVIAARWKAWGYIYPFVELGLGLMYLIGIWPFWTNVITIIVLGVSSIGVIQSNLNKRQIKCACLGDVFNLPMSTITIVEDVGMVLMAVLMLVVR